MTSAPTTTVMPPAPPAPPRSGAKRPDIEGFRAIAVLGVVVYHCHEAWLPGGYAGVDVFFILSGFLITTLLLREQSITQSIDLRVFWGRRARRLLPASVLVLVLTVLAAYALTDPLTARDTAANALWAMFFSANWRFAAIGTDYLADQDPSSVVHFWSLGVEEQYYLVWPVLLALLAVASRRWRRVADAAPVVVLGTALVAVVASFGWSLHLSWTEQPYAYFGTPARVWQLALGAALAAWTQVPRRTPAAAPRTGLRAAARWAGVAAVVWFYFFAPEDAVYPGWWALLPTLGALVAVAAGTSRGTGALATDALAGSRDPLLRGLAAAPCQALGRWSYSWYLWHWPPLVLAPIVLGEPLEPWYAALVGALTLLVAVVCHRFFEDPVRHAKVLATRHSVPSLALGLVLLIVGAGVTMGVERTSAGALDRPVQLRSGRQITPAPAEAMADAPAALTDGCEVRMLSDADSPECRYLPDRGAGDIVLFGDSHAVQWLPTLLAVAEQRGYGVRVWTHASCPAATVTKLIAGAPGTACDTWRQKTLDRIVAEKPDLVVLSGYSSTLPQVYDGGTLVRGDGVPAVYAKGLTTTLTRLSDADVPVLQIADTPFFLERAPECVLRAEEPLRTCRRHADRALGARVELATAAAVPGVRTVDFTDELCTGVWCPQIIDGVIAYRDDNHLTATMARSFAPKFGEAVAAAMTTTAPDAAPGPGGAGAPGASGGKGGKGVIGEPVTSPAAG